MIDICESIYDSDSFSIQELLGEFYDTINNCVDLVNNNEQIVEEFKDWCVDKGIPDETLKVLDKWLEDGTLESYINNNLLGDINSQVEEVKSSLEDKVNNVNSHGEKTVNLKYLPSVSDYTPVILDKINNGYRRIIIPDNATLKTTLTLKNIKDYEIVIEGSDSGANIDCRTSQLILETGGVGINSINCHNIKFRNLSIQAGDSTPSTVGIIISREGSGAVIGSSHSHIFDNVSIKMKDDMSKNGGNGTIGIYANTVECSDFNNINIFANNPVILTKNDIFNLCTYNNYNGSMKDISFSGSVNLFSYGGTSLIVDGLLNCNFNMLYVGDINKTGNSSISGVKFYGYNSLITLNLDCELYNIPISVHGRLDRADMKFNTLRPIYCIHVKNDTLKTESENAYLVNSELKITCTWDSGNIDKIHIKNESGNGISNCLFFNDNKVESSANFTGVIFICSTEPTVLKNGGTYYYTTLKGNKIGINGLNDIYYTNSMPSDSSAKTGDLAINRNLGITGTNAFYIKKYDAWVGVGQAGTRTISNISTETPRCQNEIVIDALNNIYMAYGMGIGQFKQISN